MSGKGWAILAALVVLVGGSAGCSPPGGAVGARPSATVEPTSTATAPPAMLANGQVPTAAPTQPPPTNPLPCTQPLPAIWLNVVHQGLVPTASGESLVSFAVSPDGSAAFATDWTPSWYGIVEVHAGSLARTRIIAFTSTDYDVPGGASDGRWVAFTVNHSITSLADWSLYAWDSQTGRLWNVANVTKVNGQPINGPLVIPVVSHGLLAWTDSTPAGDTVLHVVDLNTGARRAIARGHPGAPTFAWPWLMYEAPSSTNPSGMLVVTDARTVSVLATPPVLAGLGGAAFIAGAAGAVAWTSADYTTLRIWQAPAVQPLVVYQSPDSSHDAEFPTYGNGLLTWTDYDSGTIYLAHVGQPAVNITMPYTWGNLVLHDHGMVWSFSPDGNRAKVLHPYSINYVVNTDAFPALPANVCTQ